MHLVREHSPQEYRRYCDAFDERARFLELTPADRNLAWREVTEDEHFHEWPVPMDHFLSDPYYLGEDIVIRPTIREFLTEFWGPEMGYELFIIIAGLGCVDGETLIDHPDGSSTRVADLVDSDFDVLDSAGISRRATAFWKGRAPLYRLDFDDGSSFTATAAHRFLTLDGWMRVDEVDVQQPVFVPGPPVTNQEASLSTHRGDARHSSRKDVGSTARCSTSVGDDDGQPQLLSGSGRGAPPSPDDAREHSQLRWPQDAQDSGSGRSRPDRCCGPLASDGSPVPNERRSDSPPSPTRAAAGALSPRTLRERAQSLDRSALGLLARGAWLHPRLFEAPPRDPTHLPFGSSRRRQPVASAPLGSTSRSSPRSRQALPQPRNAALPSSNPQINSKRIVGVTSVGTGDFYDLSVPSTQSYTAAGAVHHNSGKSFSGTICLLYAIYQLGCLKKPARYLSGFEGAGELSGDAEIVLMNASGGGYKQAQKIVYKEALERVVRSPWFRTHFEPYEGQTELEFPNRVRLSPGTSHWESALGWNLYGFILDEAAFGIESKTVDYMKELFNNLNLRRKSRFGRAGFGGLFTSPGAEHGFIEVLAGDRRDPHILVKRTTTWEAKEEMKPGVPVFLLDRNPDKIRIVAEELTYVRPGVCRDSEGNIIRYGTPPKADEEPAAA